MSFELSNLNYPPLTAFYKPEHVKTGKGVEMEINPNLLTIERMEQVEAEFHKIRMDLLKDIQTPVKTIVINPDAAGKPKSPNGKTAEPEHASSPIEEKPAEIFFTEKHVHRFRARMLGGKPGETDPDARYIRRWKVVENGVPVPVCYETFEKLPSRVLNDLYRFVTEEAGKPTKKNEE